MANANTVLPRTWQGPSFSPAVGEMLGEYRLLAWLGRGLRGAVFLADQPGLANRPVVLKVTPRDGREHLSLAQLRHPHIVPLYCVQDLEDRDLRLLCMPYLGGCQLGQLVAELNGVPMPGGPDGTCSPGWTGRRPGHHSRRPATGPPASSSPAPRIFRRFAGSGPAWPTRYSSPTSASWSTST